MGEGQRKHTLVTDELLRTKLSPPRLGSALVPRASLLARLDAGWARKLVLISAPAGFGKTTLVAEWLNKSGVRDHGSGVRRTVAHAPSPDPQDLTFAWVSLDAGDNDPARFWRYVISACRRFDAALGKPALATLRTSQQPSLEALLTSFINELAQLPGQYVLVLEDYHTITSAQVHETLTFLLDHLPACLHLVLMTRSEPPLPLARLRARGELYEISAADLRFSHQEMLAFLQQTLRVPLAPDLVARLEERTEGWAAGLRLMTLALQGRQAPQEAEELLAALSGGQRHVLEFLAGEVLAAQPEALQTFLLQTSFLNRLTGGLCDAVTGRNDSALVLDQLERENLFLIPLGGRDDPPWYRYHALFGEAMRQYARGRLGEDGVRRLQEKASLWHETHGRLDDAAEAALAAQAFGRAATLIEQLVESRGLNELHTFPRWAEQLPPEVLYAHPALCFNYAMALLFTSDRYAPATAARIETPLRRAEETWRLEKNDPRLGQALSLRAIVALWQEDLVRSFAYSHQALELLAEHDVLWRGVNLNNAGLEALLAGKINSAQRLSLEARALCEAAQNIHARLVAAFMLGETYAWQGEFDQAGQYYQHVLAEAVGGEEMLDDQAQALLGLSAIALERNDLETTEGHASRALEFSRRRSDEARQVQAGLLLARAEQARGQTARAQERLYALAAGTRHPASLREIQAWQAWLSLVAGDLPAAERWQVAIAGASGPVSRLQQEREALIAARLRLARDDARAALELLEDWRADARAQGRTRSEIEILCLQALAHSDASRAEQTLTRALALAQPRGFRRVFLDEGERMAALLQAAIPHLTRRPLAAYAATLLRTFAPRQADAARLTSPLLEPLSPQEQRVLRLLVAGLSNPEIAQELVVSVNTVKTQVKSIYRKLDVNTREEAGEAARELKLI